DGGRPARRGRRGAALATRLRSTPGRLSSMLVGLLLLGALAGILTVVGVQQRAGKVDQVRDQSGPLTVSAQQLYRSLSDADATAAAAFLSSGAEPPQLRTRYEQDIAAATAALTAADAGRGTDQASVAQIAQALPVYTGLVETARTNNRLDLPVGAAYLREASNLMRARLLPAAQRLYQEETAALDADRSGADGFPWAAVPLVLLTLAGLALTQRYLTRRTKRLFNIGLVVGTAAGLAILIWLLASFAGVSGHLGAGRRDGSAQSQTLVSARTAALQARADEALTLVAHGNGAAFEDDFKASMTRLVGSDGKGGLLATARADATDPAVSRAVATATDNATAWRTAHANLRRLDDGGQFPQAVQLALGGTATNFTQLDTALAQAIASTSATFDRQAGQAAGALSGAGIGTGILTVLLLVGVAVGLQQRIAEYR
ncbi:MAG: hypothetical protein J2P15_16715, partial [Micromonosporaceae bacterium]|nr:hypothetical protein [Micromonosporaceae bacterium]